jgi:hypothetical protein
MRVCPQGGAICAALHGTVVAHTANASGRPKDQRHRAKERHDFLLTWLLKKHGSCTHVHSWELPRCVPLAWAISCTLCRGTTSFTFHYALSSAGEIGPDVRKFLQLLYKSSREWSCRKDGLVSPKSIPPGAPCSLLPSLRSWSGKSPPETSS